jgi:hypothetical protein
MAPSQEFAWSSYKHLMLSDYMAMNDGLKCKFKKAAIAYFQPASQDLYKGFSLSYLRLEIWIWKVQNKEQDY